MNNKVEITPEMESEIYDEYLNGKSITALKTEYKITKAKIKIIIVKAMCAGADLNVIAGQQDLALE